ncbi:Ig-like domain-containing protein [Streptomyces sp. HPF1205]|uniref:Ig-like domain-containing protein n=1 Tax=Streptomyces sp. HPF1205 TaxID=2873262 RepID=UPI001CED2FE8|nr:Ig-like domain-containing protein [Streptomyces sp. HPF1205]
MAVITSAGPLTRIEVTPDLNNAINHVGDAVGEWFANTASGTFLAVNGTLYGPAYVPAGDSAAPRTAFTPLGQSGPSGSGTAASPFTIVTIVSAGAGVTLIQTDRYVVGNEYYDTSLSVLNNSGTRQTGFVYSAGDSYLADSDYNYGRVSGTSPAASTTPGTGGRIEALLPRTPGNTYMEGEYFEIWRVIGQQQPFPNTCRCNEYVDNGIGIAWPVDLADGTFATYEWSTAFAPAGMTTTTLSSDVNPSVCGQPVTLTAQVSPVAPATGTPTGQVVFLISADGPSLTANLDGTGKAQVVVTLGVGSHDVIASYQGDFHFTGSSSNLYTQVVNKAPSRTAVTLDPSPSVCGQPVMVCATVTAGTPGSGTPTGSVTFTGPGGLNQQVNLVSGKACLTTSSLESGTVNAAYSGDGCFLNGSGTARATVNQATPSVAVTVDPSPSVCGESVMVCATVTAASPGSGTPTGSVTFTGPDGLNQQVDLVNGKACLDTAFHSSGTVNADYGGDRCFTRGSGSARVTVNPASSAMTLTVNPNQTVCGQSVRLCATVTAVQPGSGTPTGPVTFTGPDGLNQQVDLVNGQACLDATFDTSGTITANYRGDSCFTGVTSTASVTIVPVNTVLTAPPEQIRVRVNGTFVIPAMSATLKTTSGAPVAGQTVTFRANALTGPIALGSAVTDASGVATLAPPQVTVPPTAVTARTYTASFAGSTCYNPSSVSASLTSVLFPPIP